MARNSSGTLPPELSTPEAYVRLCKLLEYSRAEVTDALITVHGMTPEKASALYDNIDA